MVWRNDWLLWVVSSRLVEFTSCFLIDSLLVQSSGNPSDHLKALQNKKKLETRGAPSLQNVLQLAKTGLSSVLSSTQIGQRRLGWFRTWDPDSHLPPHGSREVIIILGSLTSCDPTNIHQTIAETEAERFVLIIPDTFFKPCTQERVHLQDTSQHYWFSSRYEDLSRYIGTNERCDFKLVLSQAQGNSIADL